MRRVLLPPLMLGLLLLGMTESEAQTLPPPTAPPQIVIVITPTPEIWPTVTLTPSDTPTPTATLPPTETPAYADYSVYATVQYGEDDPGQLTLFRYEMSAGESLIAALLGCVLGVLLLDVLLRLSEWMRK